MLRLEADLRKAEEREQLRVDFQPIISVENGTVERFEALLRWQHPELGLLMPDQFMPVAEETGLIFSLDEWVIAESCRWWKRWHAESEDNSLPESPQVKINVNLSPRHFLRRVNLAERLSEIVENEGVMPSIFGLELTENALLSFHEETNVALHELKRAGFSLYLDDFGKGYSSLSYLHHFPFDVVKIDRLFMMRIQDDGPEREIVNAILSLAAKLRLSVVAEGIETAVQMDIVRQLGCAAAQGYYISRPVAPDVAIQMVLEARTW
jgi:EAL domain-containing protein (putative c-di-GMP-specific phosphodiesterase class I)